MLQHRRQQYRLFMMDRIFTNLVAITIPNYVTRPSRDTRGFYELHFCQISTLGKILISTATFQEPSAIEMHYQHQPLNAPALKHLSEHWPCNKIKKGFSCTRAPALFLWNKDFKEHHSEWRHPMHHPQVQWWTTPLQGYRYSGPYVRAFWGQSECPYISLTLM